MRWNRRQWTAVWTAATAAALVCILLGGWLLGEESLSTRLDMRNLPPSWSQPFGTDWLGRDMFVRTVKGLALSIKVGAIAAAASGAIALTLALIAASAGRAGDRIVTWLVDLFMSVPHLVTLILIAFVTGGGMRGVVIGIALTHWPSLTRVIRAELLQIRSSDFVKVSRRLGRSGWWIATRHLLPHLVPQLLVGVLLLFPHAILHEAAITFIGLGLSPHEPAIGIILSESMRHLSAGMWWLALFPGICLVLVVRAFDRVGNGLKEWFDPKRSQW